MKKDSDPTPEKSDLPSRQFSEAGPTFIKFGGLITYSTGALKAWSEARQ